MKTISGKWILKYLNANQNWSGVAVSCSISFVNFTRNNYELRELSKAILLLHDNALAHKLQIAINTILSSKSFNIPSIGQTWFTRIIRYKFSQVKNDSKEHEFPSNESIIEAVESWIAKLQENIDFSKWFSEVTG